MKLSPKELKEHKAIVDRAGVLEAKFAALKPDADELKLLKDVIAGWYASEPPEKAMIADGIKYQAVISAKGNRREVISIAAVRRRLGDQEFMAHASIGLGVLDELLSVEELPAFIRSDRTGPRSVKTVAKAA